MSFKYLAFAKGCWERGVDPSGPWIVYTATADDADVAFLPVGQSGERAGDAPDRRLSRSYSAGAIVFVHANTAHFPAAVGM